MYDSEPRAGEGKPIEEVLPAAIDATATTEQAERESGGRELARNPYREELGMRVMHAGSPVLNVPGLSNGLLVVAACALLVVVLLLMVVVLL